MHVAKILSNTSRHAISMVVVLAWTLGSGVLAAGTVQVHGWVEDRDGRSIAGARVDARATASNHAIQSALLAAHWPPTAWQVGTDVDPSGQFILDLEPGLWTLQVTAPGHVAMQLTAVPIIDPTSVLPAVRLEPAAFAEVTVVATAGGPLPEVGLYAASDDPRWQQQSPWQPASRLGWSDKAGRWQVTRAHGEALAVRAHLPGWLDILTVPLVEQARIVVPAPRMKPHRLRLDRPPGAPLQAIIVSRPGQPWPIGLTDHDGELWIHAEADQTVLLFAADGAAGRAPLTRRGEGFSARLGATESVAGLVRDAAGSPVPHALVWPTTEPAAATRTDPAGRFVLRAPATGRASLLTRAAGHLLVQSSPPPGAPAPPSRVIELPPTTVVTGRVVDADGRPIHGAQVEGRPIARPRTTTGAHGKVLAGSRRDPTHGRVQTDAHGRFRLGGLPTEARLRLRARKLGRGVAFEEAHPGTEARIVLPRARVAHGQVLDLDNRPVAGAEVRLLASKHHDPVQTADATGRAEEGHVARTDETGRFRILGLPRIESEAAFSEALVSRASGTQRLTLHASRPGFAATVVRGLTVPLGDEPIDLGAVLLAPGARLSGAVFGRDGDAEQTKAIAEARLWVVPPASGDAFAPTRPPAEPPRATTDANGGFTVEDLDPERLPNLIVEAPGHQAVRVEATGWEQPLRIVLEPTRSITGRVEARNGEPIAGARVVAEPRQPDTAPAPKTTSGEDGRFQIDGLHPGPIEVRAEAAGFQPSEPRPVLIPRDPSPTGTVAPVEIVLVPGATLTGTVLTEDGQPVLGAAVSVGAASAIADGEGRYRLDGAPFGEQRVEAFAPFLGRAHHTLELGAGANQVDFELPGGHTITGRVLGPGELPVAGATIRLLRLDGDGLVGPHATSRETGDFRITPVVAGRYRITAEHAGLVAAEPDREVEVIDAGIADLELFLAAGARIEGAILGLSFDALAQVTVAATADTGLRRAGEVDYDGRFRVVDLTPGLWRLVAATRDGSREGSATVRIDPGVPLTERDLELGEGLTLTGRVHASGEPLAHAQLSVAPVADPINGASATVTATSTRQRGVLTDIDGGFRIADLSPGRYRVAVASRRPSLIHNVDVDLEADRFLDIEIDAGALSGQVVDRGTGTPLGRATIALEQTLASGSRASILVVTTEADGRFAFESLTAGRYRLRVRRDGYEAQEQPLEVAAGASVDGLRVALTAAAGLEVEARLASGRVPRMLTLHGRATDGRTFSATRIAQPAGATHFANLPAGQWRLLLSGTGSATAEVTAAVPPEIPGEPLQITLPSGGSLRVRIATWSDDQATGSLSVYDPAGTPHQWLAPTGVIEQTWPIVTGTATVPGLPAGAWTLHATLPTGETRTSQATTTGGPLVEAFVE